MRRFVKPEKNSSKTLLLVCIGAVMMIALDYTNNMLQERKAQDIPQAPQIEHSEIKDYTSAQEQTDEVFFIDLPQPEVVVNDAPEMAAEAPEEPVEVIVPPTPATEPVKIEKPEEQNWKDNAVPVKASPTHKTKIVIIIDDVGMDRKRSNEIIEINAPLTLAFLPYAPDLKNITERARAAGHELMIHMPMEPMNEKLDPGPVVLRTNMSKSEILENLNKAFESFDNYVGINNHMGSKVTQDEPILHIVMNALAERGLLFVDSKTIANSKAAEIAAQHGLDYAERDVFLDHQDNIEFVRTALKRLEDISRSRGTAIAIGHPKAVTIQGLREWLPTLEQKGIVVVPVSAVVKNDNPAQAVAAAPEAEELNDEVIYMPVAEPLNAAMEREILQELEAQGQEPAAGTPMGPPSPREMNSEFMFFEPQSWFSSDPEPPQPQARPHE